MIEPIGLSTSWNGTRHRSAAALLSEVRALGFRRLEAYNHFTPAQLEDLLHRAPDLGIDVASFHGPCPVATEEQERAIQLGDHLASLDEQKRLTAVDDLKRTIDWADRFGVGAVVVHLGHVDVASRQGDLMKAAAKQGRGSEAHRRLLAIARRERERAKGPHLAVALESIRTLGEYARGTRVQLGVECRDGYHEIPSLDEMAQLLVACDGLPVGYWHDAGHAAKLEYAGFLEHEEYLRRYAHRLLGMHVHDHDRGIDHQAPGQGKTDFGMLARYLKPETLVTLELSPRVTPLQISQALEILRPYGFRT